jgi:hypothetical protein
MLVSPSHDTDVTLSVVDSSGAVVARATAPSGSMSVAVPVQPTGSAEYRLQFAVGDRAVPACNSRIVVRDYLPNWVNEIEPPHGCTLWRRFDEEHPLKELRGERFDVRTRPGTSDGVTVLPCDDSNPEHVLFVTTRGDLRPPSLDDAAQFNQFYNDLRITISNAMAPMLGGLGFGASCRRDAGAGFVLYVSDFRQVDEAVRRLSAVLHERRLQLPVSVVLMEVLKL